MQKLYLKLDNKLILKIGVLNIPKKKDRQDIGHLDKSIRMVRRVLKYFEYIELNNIEFTDIKYKIIYEDNIIYISSDEYEIAGMITPYKNFLKAKLPLVYIKKYDLSLKGDLRYDYLTKKISIDGSYSVSGIDGNITAQLEDKKVKFAIASDEFGDLKKLLDTLAISEDTRTWIDRRVQAESYKLLSLSGRGIWSDDGFDMDTTTLKGRAELTGVDIYFHDTLMPIKAKSATIDFHNDRLNVELQDPYYLNKSMQGSKISILNITGDQDLKLLIKLNFNCRYDREIDKLLEGYDISIPIEQKKGKSKVEIKLDIDPKKSKVKTEGRVFVSKGVMRVVSAILPTKGGEITFNSHRVALWGLDIFDDWYRAKINGFINLTTDKARFKMDLKKLQIGDNKSTSVQIKNMKKLDVKMDFKDGLKFDIPKLNLKIKARKHKGIEIVSRDIRPLLKYMIKLPLKISSGNFSVLTKDYKKYSFTGNAKWTNSYTYGKKGYISSVPFNGTFKNSAIVVKALGDKFTYNSAKSTISLKSINIDAKKMTTLYGSKKGKGISKLRVKGKHSIIRYDKYVLLTDFFDLHLRPNKITFLGKSHGDTVRLVKNGNNLSIKANKIKDKMLRSLINFGGMHGGRYSLDFSGKTNAQMRGVIDIKGGAVSSFKAYNDIIALFNTLPALMALSDPGFSKKGFVIKDGKIKFRLMGNILHFDKIYLNGKSSTIAGKGRVNIKNGKINIDIVVRTAREIGGILGSLPVVGYIIFGKDKSVTTGVKIRGTMDKPIVKTNPVGEALLLPFELIRRTITSPAHIINN